MAMPHFLITNADGKTTFLFRTPSVGGVVLYNNSQLTIDYSQLNNYLSNH